MASRNIAKTDRFARNLKQLAKRHRELTETVKAALDVYAAGGPSHSSDRIPGLDDQPVYKDRLALRNQGRRGGARIIYYCDAHTVQAMFLYLKSDQADIPTKEIKEALKGLDLPTPPKESG